VLEGLTVSEDFVPTYSYACTECDNRFDEVQAFSDDALTTCAKCNGRLRKLFGKVGVVFKGSGFYRNDSRDSSKSSSTGSAATSGDSSSSAGSSSSGSSDSAGSSSSSESSFSGSSSSGSSSSGSSSSSSSSTPAAASS
jgi:putative FmdB family regulatory protein